MVVCHLFPDLLRFLPGFEGARPALQADIGFSKITAGLGEQFLQSLALRVSVNAQLALLPRLFVPSSRLLESSRHGFRVPEIVVAEPQLTGVLGIVGMFQSDAF